MAKSESIGALWKNVKGFISGNLKCIHCKEENKIIIFPNSFKNDNPKAPDFNILESKPKEGAAKPKSEGSIFD